MRFDDSREWKEFIIDENCNNDKFYEIARVLQFEINVLIETSASDLDSIYLNFIYKDAALTLHYNIYIGVTLFPKALKDATDHDNKMVVDLSERLLEYYKGLNEPAILVSQLFAPLPGQWGLRGDPYLWREMKQDLTTTVLPASANDLKKLLHESFEKLVGEKPQKDKFIHLKKYETQRGISNGVVSGDFWIDKGFELIIQRFNERRVK